MRRLITARKRPGQDRRPQPIWRTSLGSSGGQSAPLITARPRVRVPPQRPTPLSWWNADTPSSEGGAPCARPGSNPGESTNCTASRDGATTLSGVLVRGRQAAPVRVTRRSTPRGRSSVRESASFATRMSAVRIRPAPPQNGKTNRQGDRRRLESGWDSHGSGLRVLRLPPILAAHVPRQANWTPNPVGRVRFPERSPKELLSL